MILILSLIIDIYFALMTDILTKESNFMHLTDISYMTDILTKENNFIHLTPFIC